MVSSVTPIERKGAEECIKYEVAIDVCYWNTLESRTYPLLCSYVSTYNAARESELENIKFLNFAIAFKEEHT